MTNQRTGGMLAIGIINIIIGAFGTLGALLIVLGGGLLAAGGAAMEASGDPNATGMGALGALGGGIVVLVGLVTGVFCLLLLVSGIGVIKVAPWGRTLSIVGGIGLFIVNGLSIMGEPGFLNFVMLGYGGVLTVLCFTSTWKQAFSGEPVESLDDSMMDSHFTPTTSGTGIPGMPAAGSTDAPGSTPAPDTGAATTPSPQPAPTADSGTAAGTDGFSGLPGVPPAPQQNTQPTAFNGPSGAETDDSVQTKKPGDDVSDVAA